MADIFISYGREDRERVEPLALALLQQGWSVWWDVGIFAGQDFRVAINTELLATRCIVVVWTKTSIARRWVIEEADEGCERKILVPVLFDDVKPPRGFRGIQAANLIEWDKTESSSAFQQFITSLSEVLGPPPQKPALSNGNLTQHPADSAAREKQTSSAFALSTRTVLWLAVNVMVTAIMVAGGQKMNISENWHAFVPLAGCIVALFLEVKSSAGKSRPRWEAPARQSVIREIYEGVLAGIAGGICTGVAIGIPYYWVLRDQGFLLTGENASIVILQISVFTSMVGATLGVLYNAVARGFQDTGQRRKPGWFWNEVWAATLAAIPMGVLFGAIGGYYFGQKQRPIVESTWVIAGGLAGVWVLIFFLASYRDRCLRWSNAGAALVSVLPPLMIAAFVTAILFGAGLSFEAVAASFEQLEQEGVVGGGIVYGIAVSALLGMAVGVAAVISRLDSRNAPHT